MHRNSLASALLASATAFLPSLAQAVDPANTLRGQDAFGDWQDSKPGVWRHIKAADLPPPFAGG